MFNVYAEKSAIPAEATIINAIVRDKATAEELLSLIEKGKKVAVAFYSDVPDSDDVLAAVERVRAAEEKVAKYAEEKTVRKFQAKTIGCRFCDSSIAKDYLKSDICPVCGHDLRIQSVIDGENQLKQKVEDAKAQLELQKDINCIKNGKILYLSNAIAESADVYPGDGEDCVTSECLANEE